MKRPFKSFLAPLFEEFILSRQDAGQWCKTYYENLHYFDNYIWPSPVFSFQNLIKGITVRHLEMDRIEGGKLLGSCLPAIL